MTARRSELATLFSALKRVRPTVPFFKLAAHRIPTLWQLYRGLLRSTMDYKNINMRLRTLFRSHRYLTSPQKTKEQLERGHRWLNIFLKSHEGDAYSKRLVERYDRFLEIKAAKERWKQIFDNEMEWSKKMNSRSILTGSIVRPTIYNKPFPRMRPQPTHVSMMIHSRRKARERRGERQQQLLEYRDHIKHEQFFEHRLCQNVQSRGLSFTPIFQSVHEWFGPLDAALDEIQKSYALDEARSKSACSPELLAQVKEARREKIRNKTREKRRERSGEVLNHTIRRMRQGPPAPLLALMTDEERKMDRLIRSPSEGGYTGMMKRRAGIKLKDDHSWRLEDGLDEMQPKLEEMEKEFYILQEAKRNQSGVEGDTDYRSAHRTSVN